MNSGHLNRQAVNGGTPGRLPRSSRPVNGKPLGLWRLVSKPGYGGPWANVASARYASSLTLLALLSACATVGPDYVAPTAPVISHYSEADPAGTNAGTADAAQQLSATAALSDRWWQAFGSAELNRVVELALAGSPTQETAAAALVQARAAVEAAGGAWYPQISFNASASRSRTLAAPDGVNSASLGPTLSFGVDAFGLTSRRVEQAQALAAVQEAQAAASRLTLVSGVVQQALALASALEQLRAVQHIIVVDQHNLELVQVAQAAGKSAGLDVLTAESHLASDRALLPSLQQQASVARHALAVLVGQTPSQWQAPDFAFAALTLPQDLPLSLPSDLLRQRPDIRIAEAQLHAASAAIGVAAAQLYPSLTLTASWSAVSSGGGALLANPASVWTIAADLLAPLFNGGTLRAQREAAVAAYAGQLGSYRQSLLLAFAQVADLLEALAHDAALVEAQHKALDAAQASLDLTQQSFEAGQSNVLQVIEAQRQYQQALLGYVRARAQRYADTAQWFVALGG